MGVQVNTGVGVEGKTETQRGGKPNMVTGKKQVIVMGKMLVSKALILMGKGHQIHRWRGVGEGEVLGSIKY